MKKIIYLLVCLFLLAGCSSKTVPGWIKTSHTQLESYKKHFLQGKDRYAEGNFRKTIEEMKTGGDFNLLQIAYLTQYALQVSVLETFDDKEYRRLAAIEPNPENTHFHAFLRGAFDRTDELSLPSQYRPFLRACNQSKQMVVNDAIAGMEDPLSRLIASGLAVQQGRYNEQTILTAIQTASEQGWKKALLAYLKKLRDLYASTDLRKKAEEVQQKMDLLN
jgi:hypothetical protein